MKYFRVLYRFECPACQADNRGKGVSEANNRTMVFGQVSRTVQCLSCGYRLLDGKPLRTTIQEITKAFHIDYSFVCAKCKKENRAEKILWAEDEAAARGRMIETTVCRECHAKLPPGYEIGSIVTEVTER
jgi:hypothetical protein